MQNKYKPLDEVRKSLKIEWYRCPISREKLRELSQRSDLKGWVQSLGFLAIIGATGTLTWVFAAREMWWAFAAALYLHGTVYSFIPGIATHELSHGTVFKTKSLNDLFLRIFSLLAWVNFHQYKRSHTYHHQFTLHTEADGEVVLPRDPSLRARLLFFIFTINLPAIGTRIGTNILLLAFLGRFREKGDWSEALFPEADVHARRRAVNWARTLVAFHTVIIAVSIAFGFWQLPLIVTFASFIANWWRYFVGFTMHTGLRDNVADFRKCCRTITLDPFSRFIYWHMNYHTEHHMYAAVPCYNLTRLAKEIAWNMPKPRTLTDAWHEMRETAKRQKFDPGYQFDTPVPVKAEQPRKGEVDLASSIGDLAPEDLA
jgi:fatty acid desaturase